MITFKNMILCVGLLSNSFVGAHDYKAVIEEIDAHRKAFDRAHESIEKAVKEGRMSPQRADEKRRKLNKQASVFLDNLRRNDYKYIEKDESKGYDDTFQSDDERAANMRKKLRAFLILLNPFLIFFLPLD